MNADQLGALVLLAAFALWLISSVSDHGAGLMLALIASFVATFSLGYAVLLAVGIVALP